MKVFLKPKLVTDFFPSMLLQFEIFNTFLPHLANSLDNCKILVVEILEDEI